VRFYAGHLEHPLETLVLLLGQPVVRPHEERLVDLMEIAEQTELGKEHVVKPEGVAEETRPREG
jgi:hypothetical protein